MNAGPRSAATGEGPTGEGPTRGLLGLQGIRRLLVDAAGGWLSNTVAEPRVTCAICRIPTGGGLRCEACTAAAEGPYGDRLADRVASVAYAVKGLQSGHVMHGYKAKPPVRPVRDHILYVAVLAAVALLDHSLCAGRLVGLPITGWSVVPSLPAAARPGEHPLRPLVSAVAPGTEVTLVAASAAWQPREVHPRHYAVAGPLPEGAHVLVIDDTWVTGGHEQSAAVALRAAGASAVSVLALTRWLRPDDLPTAAFLKGRRTDLDPRVCPWTAGTCPPSRSPSGHRSPSAHRSAP